MIRLSSAIRHGMPLVAALLGTTVFAGAPVGDAGLSHDAIPYAPALREPAPTQLLWGDLHLHTGLSMDAYINGTRLDPEAAYRFAMGETVAANNGTPARLGRPLDFLAITDHSENMGVYTSIAAGDPRLDGTPVATRWTEVLGLVGELGLQGAFRAVMGKHGPLPDLPETVLQSTWRDAAQLADTYNRPGHFTTLIGYEWTSMISGDNLHRVVLYRDDAARAGQQLPASAQRDPDPESLWQALADYEKRGGQALAIPHNGNLSNGRMFAPERINGEPLDAGYAENRARWEPVFEVTQVKGDSEAHPNLSPDDPFSDFENWDRYNVAETAPKEPWMLRYEYARPALAEGLRHQQSLGVNPFMFGMIGSSDIHTGLSTVEENNFYGKFLSSEPSADRFASDSPNRRNRELGASGLAAVWAPDNTREAIFDAIRRREVYATTGTRIRLRLFGGWAFAADDIHRADYVRHAYSTGVAMGSELPPRTTDTSPGFLVHAARDPEGAYLDRIQIIKAWVDDSGRAQERVYDVALAGEERRAEDGTVADIGSTVDTGKATYSNAIGAPELAAWWRDPDHDPDLPAVYYARVLEIPTPRWTTYDAAHFGATLPDDQPATLQERAYSSPIWYRPR